MLLILLVQFNFYLIFIINYFFPGRFDVSHVLPRCLQCNKDVPTSNPLIVAQLGFWPGSVSSPTYVFNPSLFLHWDLFQKESPGSSERSFLKSLEQFALREGRVCMNLFPPPPLVFGVSNCSNLVFLST